MCGVGTFVEVDRCNALEFRLDRIADSVASFDSPRMGKNAVDFCRSWTGTVLIT